jgi:nucleoside-diphosphate-sugar epimerase
MISLYRRGRWRIIPGNGKSIGNYVYVEDVARGHILAMERGKPGERYILGGENCDFLTFFKTVAGVTGRSYRMIKLPLSVMLAAAKCSEVISSVAGGTPFITTGHVRRYNHDWLISSEKAEKVLGYSITPLKEGIERTVQWLDQNSTH